MAIEISGEFVTELGALRQALLHKIRLDDNQDPGNIMGLVNAIWKFLAKVERNETALADFELLNKASTGYTGVHNCIGGLAMAKGDLFDELRRLQLQGLVRTVEGIDVSAQAWTDNMRILRDDVKPGIADELLTDDSDGLDTAFTNLHVAVGLGLVKAMLQTETQKAAATPTSSPLTPCSRAQSSPEFGQGAGAALGREIETRRRSNSMLGHAAASAFDDDAADDGDDNGSKKVV